MKKLKIGGAVAAVLLALGSWASSLEVTDVKIAQRYPWNGLVDITYTVTSDDANKDVWVYPVGYDADTATSVALMPQYLSGEGASNAVHQGTHQMTWNMAAQMGKNYNRAAFSVKLHAYCDSKPYLVVDLSEGSEAKEYPISYLSEIPAGGWTDEYKTTKLVLKLIPPGQVDSQTFITKPFYFAIWPMTTQQYALIMGGTGTSETKSGLSYNDIRGAVLGAKYPEHQQVDADSILGKMRLRTGVTFDLATECQWKAAALAYIGTESGNPNAFGICQLGVNVEWCLNWHSGRQLTGIDPTGPMDGSNRSVCGYSESPWESICYFSFLTYWSYPNNLSSWTDRYTQPSFNGLYKWGEYWRQYDQRVDPACRLVALPACR